MSSKKHFINCLDGFFSRIIKIFLKLKIARTEQKELSVFWPINDHCTGHFLDFFYPIRGVEFVNKKTNRQGFETNWSNISGILFFNDLKLLPHVKNKIFNFKKKIEKDYVAIHVRRTDIFNKKHNNSITTYDHFLYWLNKKNKPIFLATDNRETQLLFLKIYGNNLFYFNEIKNKNHRRQTNLENSIIDFFMCIYSKEFMGTNLSCWNGLIKKLMKERSDSIKLF